VKYTDDLVLPAKEETALHVIIYSLIETGRSYERNMNVEKTKLMRISRQPSPLPIMIVITLENVECFSYLGGMITSDARDRTLWRPRLGRGCGSVVRETTE
jgi:hypothetical protein